MRGPSKRIAGAVLAAAVLAVSMGQVRITRSWSGVPFIWVGDGSASAPSVAFASEPTIGWYRGTAGRWTWVGGSSTNYFSLAAGQVSLHQGQAFGWTSSNDSNGTLDTYFTRGGAAGKVTLTGTTPMLQLGGTTSSFPALKRNGAVLEVKLADDSAYGSVRAQNVNVSQVISGSGAFLISDTNPSAPSSCGTSPAVTTANGTAAWVVTGGTGGSATGCTITMPTATTGWNCHITNITQTAANRADRDTRQTASTTTSVTWQYVVVSTGAATAFTASDVFRGLCFAY